jgi:hypothetical protein
MCLRRARVPRGLIQGRYPAAASTNRSAGRVDAEALVEARRRIFGIWRRAALDRGKPHPRVRPRIRESPSERRASDAWLLLGARSEGRGRIGMTRALRRSVDFEPRAGQRESSPTVPLVSALRMSAGEMATVQLNENASSVNSTVHVRTSGRQGACVGAVPIADPVSGTAESRARDLYYGISPVVLEAGCAFHRDTSPRSRSLDTTLSPSAAHGTNRRFFRVSGFDPSLK